MGMESILSSRSVAVRVTCGHHQVTSLAGMDWTGLGRAEQERGR